MYPAWFLPTLSTALIIALVATFHILPSHLATSALWFSVYVERKAHRENRPELMEFIKRFALLILIFCFIYGSITGVGIWFSAAVAAPRAISALIHNYVWGWATEWVFFIIEIVTIYAYYYTLNRVAPEHHLRIGWIYAWGAWISMVIITGILAFMLTPDTWFKTGGFFDGFFNSTYWPQLLARTGFMFALAAIYALITASRLSSPSTKETITKLASLWGMAGIVAGGVFSLWYIHKLPAEARELMDSLPYLKQMLVACAVLSAVVFAYFAVGYARPKFSNMAAAIVMLLVLFAAIGAGEGFREGVRRPYIIGGLMYGSSQVIARDVPAKRVKAEVKELSEKGFLSRLFYLPDEMKRITDKNRVEIGKVIVAHQCGGCHSIRANGPIRPLAKLLSGMEKDDIKEILDSLGDYPYMPPFVGTDQEKDAVAAYLATIANK